MSPAELRPAPGDVPPIEATPLPGKASGTVRTVRLPGLEALRCVAAACVLLLHARAVYGNPPSLHPDRLSAYVAWVLSGFGRGYLGVDFFLMLSGFLMALVQEPRLASMKMAGSGRFLLNRYRRLWPMMALGGAIGLPMQYLGTHSAGEFVRISALNLALLPTLGQFFAFPLNIPAWTIFAELVVNTAHVLILRHVRGRWLCALLALSFVGMVAIAHHYGSLDLGAKPQTLLAGLARCTFAYMIGMACGRSWGAIPPLPLSPLPVPPLLAFIAMPLAIWASWRLHMTGWWPDITFVIVICPLMLAGGLRLRRGGWLAGLAGALAFPLFAIQMPILQGLQHLGFGYWMGLAGAFAGGMIVMAGQIMLARLRRRA